MNASTRRAAWIAEAIVPTERLRDAHAELLIGAAVFQRGQVRVKANVNIRARQVVNRAKVNPGLLDTAAKLADGKKIHLGSCRGGVVVALG
jgi:hypothetical protein